MLVQCQVFCDHTELTPRSPYNTGAGRPEGWKEWGPWFIDLYPPLPVYFQRPETSGLVEDSVLFGHCSFQVGHPSQTVHSGMLMECLMLG